MTQRTPGILLMVYAALMLMFAYLWHFALPFEGKLENYPAMLAHDQWFVIYAIGWTAVPIGMLALISLHGKYSNPLSLPGTIGFVLVFLGFFIQGCLLSWEAFLWPIVGNESRSAFLIQEAVFIKSPPVAALYISFSIAFSVGFVLLGYAWMKAKLFPKAAVIMVMLGAFVYSFAVAFGGWVGLIAFTIYLFGILSLGWFHMNPDPYDKAPTVTG